MVQDRDQWRALVDTVMNLGVPKIVGKFISSFTTGSFSRRAELHGVCQVRNVTEDIQSGKSVNSLYYMTYLFKYFHIFCVYRVIK
jgi:hypothetical protein